MYRYCNLTFLFVKKLKTNSKSIYYENNSRQL